MPILLKCSQCQEQLEVDEAFAGGICRCVHCGTLSQVPTQATQLDRKGRPTTPPPMAKPVIAPPGREEELHIAPTRQFIAHRKRMGLLGILLMVVALAMLVVFIWAAVKLFGPQPQDGAPVVVGTSEKVNPIDVATGPNFFGLKIAGTKVAYVLDTGGKMREGALDGAGPAVRLSIKSLPKAARLVVVAWPQGGGGALFGQAEQDKPQTYPADGLEQADGAAAQGELKTWLENLTAAGPSAPVPAVQLALERGADTLVLITRDDLSGKDAAAIRDAVKGKSVALLGGVLGNNGGPTDYGNLNDLCGGQVYVASLENLQEWMSRHAGE